MRTEALSLPLSEPTMDSLLYQPMLSMQHIICHLQSMLRFARVGLVTITLQFAPEKQTEVWQQKVDQSRHYLLENLRPRVRKTDTFLLLDQTCYIVLRGANQQGAAIVQERLWEALLWTVHNLSEQEYIRPQAMEMGHGAYPELYPSLEHCLRSALEPSQRFIIQRGKNISKAAQVCEALQTERVDALHMLARQLGIPYLPTLPSKLSKRVLRLIDRQIAQELHCLPLGRERDTLTVAMLEPQNQKTIERLQNLTGLRIFPVLTNQQELQRALEEQQTV